MKLQQIRENLHRKGAYHKTLRDELVGWLSLELSRSMCIGLTLMPNKIEYLPRKGIELRKRHVNKSEIITRAKRFTHLLNDCVYKQAYRRYGKKIDSVMTIEGEKSFKDLHCHFALSKPENMSVLEFKQRIDKALLLCADFCIVNAKTKEPQHKIDLVDGDWMVYITKELDSKTFENLYLL